MQELTATLPTPPILSLSMPPPVGMYASSASLNALGASGGGAPPASAPAALVALPVKPLTTRQATAQVRGEWGWGGGGLIVRHLQRAACPFTIARSDATALLSALLWVRTPFVATAVL